MGNPAGHPTRTSPTPAAARRYLGSLLVDRGIVDPDRLAVALERQRRTGERLGQALVSIDGSLEREVFRTLAEQLGLPYEEGPLHPEPEAGTVVDSAFARRHGVIPLAARGRSLRVAVGDPLEIGLLDDLRFQTGLRVEAVVTPPSVLEAHLAGVVTGRPDPAAGEGEGDPLRPHDAASALAVVPFLDRLLRDAAEAGASDLHVEQGEDGVLIRERIDGVLRDVTSVPPGARATLLSRIKILGGMDIAVKRRPQDGGFPLALGGRRLSVRVSTLPVEAGEKAVLRFLDPRSAPANLEAVGLAEEDLDRVRLLARGGRGVLLAAGPTGSGKSSTLFGVLAELNRRERNIVTLEDPIEYRVPGVNQVQVDPKAGLTFPVALRAILRQDPDIIMVGEIRDRETAEIAMAAAITGHLVLSTIHTVDAPSGVTRLLQMGVPAHLLAGGLAGIVAQRLVRRACGSCGGRPGGCDACHDGYRGRTGVFQVLVVTEALREAIGRGAEGSEIRRRSEEAGMGTMAADARRKVSEGITTPHEVARVLREDPGVTLPCRACGGGLPLDGLGCPHCGRPRTIRCRCGRVLQSGWRYCADCLRPAPPGG